MHILVVDDEPLARVRLVRLLQQQGDHRILEASDGLAALDLINDNQFDIAFLDIRMPGIDGLKLSQLIKRKASRIKIVFTTAYERFAMDAFESHAAGYLLKPIDFAKLDDLIGHIRGENKGSLICVQQQQKRKVNIEDISCCYADSKYVTVLFQQQSALTDFSLKKILQQWPQDFIQVHRNTLINPDYLVGLEKTAKGYCASLMATNVKPMVSRRSLKLIKSYLSHV